MLNSLIEFTDFLLDGFSRTEIPLVCIDLFASSGLGSSVNFCIFRLETMLLSIESSDEIIGRLLHFQTFVSKL